jgi:hypothetical protein
MINKKFIRSKKIKPSRIERQKYYNRTIKKYDKVKVEKNVKVAKGSHSFLINSCNYDKTPHLDESILYKYLLALGLVPDSRAMAYVDNQYKLIMSEKKISKKDFCYIFDLKLQIRIPNNIIKADVFFYNINSFHLDKLFYKYPKFLCNILNIDKSILSIAIVPSTQYIVSGTMDQIIVWTSGIDSASFKYLFSYIIFITS